MAGPRVHRAVGSAQGEGKRLPQKAPVISRGLGLSPSLSSQLSCGCTNLNIRKFWPG